MTESSKSSKSIARERHFARRMAVQAVYQHLMNKSGDPEEDLQLIKQYLDHPDAKKANVEFFRELLVGVLDTEAALEELITPLLDRRAEQIDPVEWAVMFVSTHELKAHLETPYRVAINEAIELAKLFGAAESHKYINGVVDKLARKLREVEYKAQR